jgi:hypothetical protein
MKKTILILSTALLISCNKSKTQPTPAPQSTPQVVNVPTNTVTSNTITFNFDPSSIGYLYINWHYKPMAYTPDSVYQTYSSITITRVLTTDSIRYRFFSNSCSTCGSDPSNLKIYKNGLLLNSFNNDYGSSFRYISLK